MPQAIVNKLVLVTGGARGIGRATAQLLLENGARVVLADLDGAVAQATCEALSDRGEVHSFALDVADAEAFDALVEQVEREIGPVDVLVNNAGIMALGAFLDQPRANDAQQIAVNLVGVINGMRAVLPRMASRGRGQVVNVASMAGKVPVPFAAVYTATKHAVVGLTEAVRAEMSESGVDFTYIMPIPVKTELLAGAKTMKWPPPVEADDVARAILGALRDRQVEVFVPSNQRMIAMLPVVAPRFLVERLAKSLGLDRLFAEVDRGEREAYEARTTDRKPDSRR